MPNDSLPEQTNPARPDKPVELPPELLREIADKVYDLLVRRLQVERERDRLANDEWDLRRWG